jgi:hypothetical protein
LLRPLLRSPTCRVSEEVRDLARALASYLSRSVNFQSSRSPGLPSKGAMV